RRLDQLDAVIVQPSAGPKSVALFRFRRCELVGPENFLVETEDESQSSETRLRAVLENFVPAGARSASQFAEELALLKRWHYRTHKLGEMILADRGGEISVRKLGNAIKRVYRGEKQPAHSQSQPEAATP